MRDPWLRNNPVKWLPSPQNQGLYTLKLSDLMIDGERKWDVNKIHALFPVATAEAIIMREFRPGAQLDIDVNWSAVWRIRAPPKAKHVSWRICKGCIPTRV
jgi:hypothetical protein